MQIDPQLLDFLKQAVAIGASDIHISVATPPMIRLNSQIRPLEGAPRLMPPDTQRLLFSIIDEEHMKTLLTNGEVDMSYGVPDVGRFRVNVYKQRGSFAAAIRIMNTTVPDPKKLEIPETIINLYKKKSGLVLVTGPTGSGKSTTLAAIIQQVNLNRHCHVLTLEDPIEYLYRHNCSLVDQREIGLDSRTFATALRAALREDPDVILVGEMRDLETISTAITAAETGHLVFSSLHTNDTASTINRIIDVFPENQKEQIRTQLSMVLESVISQRLLPKADGSGRTACFEIMHCNPAIRSLIRENKIHQIPGIIQTSSKAGMITMDEALYQAVQEGRISRETALEYSDDAPALELRFGGSKPPVEEEKPRFRW
ncbi:MAG: type IV pilus twitching motility protein PilT [Lachnospiraceae bacterium]|nr:type IV pilus twitching motility protein PilT [Lachnospiraceae bacterium]